MRIPGNLSFLIFVAATVFLALSSGSSSAARSLRLNLGTIAPQGSSAHKALMMMRQKWSQSTDGEVRLVIYPDGVQGGEADMVRLIRVGLLQAGLFTATGLSEIEPRVKALQNMPMVFHNLREYDFVSEVLQPQLAQSLDEKGYVVLFWIDAGWIRIFSKKKARFPDDLRKLKWFAWDGSHEQVRLMRGAGYQPVMLETAEIIPGLQTGLIEAVAVPPIFALAGQLDGRAPYMLELNYAPLIGAAIVAKSAWGRIPEEVIPTLLEAAEEAGGDITAKSRQESLDSVTAMQRRGLKVQTATPEITAAWRREAESLYPQIRGRLVPAEIFDEVRRLLREFRSGQRQTGE